jgi:glycosyltransferase involved in cell wall biosynthesis
MSMPLASVITAAYAPLADFLSDTIASVEAVILPAGWELEWIVQEDGDQPELAERFAGVELARYSANGRQMGISSTRNLALSRASGVLIQALDQDDIVLPNLLTALIPRFEEYAIHWAIGQADDLMTDGQRRSFPSLIPFGLLKAGRVNQWAAEHGGNWPIHGAALMMRAASWRALGGWTGIPYDDELATFAALSQMTDGYHEETLTWLYRYHPKQIHRTQAVQMLSATGRRIALQRAAAVEALGLGFLPEAGAGFEGQAQDVNVGPAAKDTTL